MKGKVPLKIEDQSVLLALGDAGFPPIRRKRASKKPPLIRDCN
jgi:hypothetical protein